MALFSFHPPGLSACDNKPTIVDLRNAMLAQANNVAALEEALHAAQEFVGGRSSVHLTDRQELLDWMASPSGQDSLKTVFRDGSAESLGNDARKNVLVQPNELDPFVFFQRQYETGPTPELAELSSHMRNAIILDISR